MPGSDKAFVLASDRDAGLWISVQQEAGREPVSQTNDRARLGEAVAADAEEG